MPTPTTLLEARAAIEQILAALPNAALPKPDKVEADPDGTVIAWFGGHGYHLGSARRGNERIPGGTYRETGAWDAVVGEAVRRLDLAHEPDPAGRPCSCGSDATSLNPAEVLVHRIDGPCYIAAAFPNGGA